MFGQWWSVKGLLLLAWLARLLLVYYARIHDYMFEVKFTDVDYRVYTDAARYLSQGQSPFNRATFRYSPVLAWLLLPNMRYAEFGKLLFISADVCVGWLLYTLCMRAVPKQNVAVRAMCLWLFNPITLVVSARGNADVLVCALVLLTLYLITNQQTDLKTIMLAGVVHGAGAVHLKLYPVIYLPSIYLYLCPPLDLRRASSSRDLLNQSLKLIDLRAITFCLLSVWSASVSFYLCYVWCGPVFVEEALLYHAHRSDIRHNFSPYFLPLYLTGQSPAMTRALSLLAFIPQAALILLFAFRYAQENLSLCWFLSTFAFVSLNKVCTSQYFVWYLCLVPLVYAHLCSVPCTQQYVTGTAPRWALLWMVAQGLWLAPAYLLEFQGLNVFVLVWVGSVLLLSVNIAILHSILTVCNKQKGLNQPVPWRM